MKKGQSALEYLVTYGWAILAIVIIAVLLFYFGIFNPATWTATENRITGLGAFGVEDFRMFPNGTINFYFINNKGFRVNITDMYFRTNRPDATWTDATLTPADAQRDWISSGTRININASNTGITGKTGDVITNVQIAITYRVQTTGEYHNDTGSLSGKIE